MLKIAIIGTRGIPNQYGGFEQAAEFLSVGLVNKGHDVSVYNSHNHPFKESIFEKVKVIHCYDPEYLLGTAGQFIYDYNCIRDATKRNFDVLLFLGYTSSSVWWRLFPKESLIVSNMDGLEWKRTKYNKALQKFLKYAEYLAVKHSQFLVADSTGIQQHLLNEYERRSQFIPYGADGKRKDVISVLNDYDLKRDEYYLLMARMEPENNIELILQGFSLSASEKEFIVIGNNKNKYGRTVTQKFAHNKKIRFVGAIYDQDKVHTLRKYCSMYFHGHSVGGTNPSLLEAMASGAFIVAHDNVFNRSVLENDARYFLSANDVSGSINSVIQPEQLRKMKDNNSQKIKNIYNWERVVDEYEQFLVNCYQKSRNGENSHNRRHAV